MKKRTLIQMGIHALSGLIFALPILAAAPVKAQIFKEYEKEKTLSPYFMIPNGDPSTDKIPLLSTSADVKIAGVIADVTITQVYKNEGENPIEAIYVFPASTRAAVYSMQMTIGERKIVAKIEERKKAREAYEEARNNGQSASLLEQERPNVFTMSVANIMPGDEILVEMSYTELLIPESGVYEFVYPTVVGPRYSNNTDDLASNTDIWIKNPYTHEGEAPLYEFDIKASISAGLPIQEISCKTHDMAIAYDDPSLATLKLKDGHAASGNRDVIIRYRLAGGKIESGLLLYEGKEENFFLAMIQPPARPKAEQIPPREYIFIVDISGSMWGFPLDISKELMRNLLGKLKSTDRFNILLFAGGSSLFSERSLEANEGNIRRGINFIDRQHGGGGTELLPALKRALALKGTEDYARSFVILTDGYVSVEKEAFDLIRASLGEANFFPFGIGSSVNRHLIEGMAHAGMGSPFVVTSGEYADATAEKFRNYIQHPVLTNIKVSYDGFEVYDVEPLSMADVFAERPLVIFGKWKGKAGGSILIEGTSGEGRYINKLDVDDYTSDTRNAALTYLWAREKIKVLDDYASLNLYTSGLEEEVTALGLKYNLLTQYTSFVAIDNRVRNEDGTFTTVNQALPLPEGVSNYAVGGISGYNMQKSHSQKYMPSRGGSGRTQDCEELSITLNDAPVVTDVDEVHELVEKPAEFTGDKDGVEAFLKKNIAYPADALSEQLEGTVYVKFVIDTDGSISDIEIVSSTDPVFEQEAIRLIDLTSKMWDAARQSGKKVKSKMILEIV
ncbi:MAG: TonB family protein, partial [Bacteroidales bacterium]|nr:TonB family protein [Bacteroidales bacterium]